VLTTAAWSTNNANVTGTVLQLFQYSPALVNGQGEECLVDEPYLAGLQAQFGGDQTANPCSHGGTHGERLTSILATEAQLSNAALAVKKIAPYAR
jgi:hypothetical protein